MSATARLGSPRPALSHSNSGLVLRSLRRSTQPPLHTLPLSPHKHPRTIDVFNKTKPTLGHSCSGDLGKTSAIRLEPLRPQLAQMRRQQENYSLRPVTSTRASLQLTPKPKVSKNARIELTSLVTQTAVPSGAGYKEYLASTLQALRCAQSLPQVDLAQLASKRILLPKRPGWLHKKTIIFDLDETLVHCSDELSPNLADVSLPIAFPSGEVLHAGVNIRPYVRECLSAANQDFEVIVFTASHRWYADVILDYLDPQHTLIHHRLYRDSCVMTGGVLVKDLRIFANRNLEDLVIVDNMAYSFAFQLDNGIPIRSWKEDETDRELVLLCDYMKKLAAVSDVRELNARTFGLKTFLQNYTSPSPKPFNLSIR